MSEVEPKLIPINDYPWSTDDFSWMYHLTCKNHTSAKYYTKNPWSRNLHLINVPEGLNASERSSTGECLCPMSDLVVIVKPNSREERELKSKEEKK